MISDKKLDRIVNILKNDGIGVIPTDTIYGLVGSVFSEKAVERIFKVKNREKDKPLIVLVSSISDLKKFDIEISDELKRILKKYWPGKNSIILQLPESSLTRLKYIHRGTNSLAFRFPKKESLIKILQKTGPLVAPSANPEKFKPAENIIQAKKYFKNEVDFYIASGTLKSKASTLIRINEDGSIEVLRGIINNNGK